MALATWRNEITSNAEDAAYVAGIVYLWRSKGGREGERETQKERKIKKERKEESKDGSREERGSFEKKSKRHRRGKHTQISLPVVLIS